MKKCLWKFTQWNLHLLQESHSNLNVYSYGLLICVKKNLKGQVTSKYQRYTKFWRIYICINVHVTDLIIKFLFIYFLLFFLVTERAIRNKLFACTERDNYICGQQAWNLSTSWVKYNTVEAFCRGALGTWQAR